jgi:two-component system OmpR family sensor kinase
VAARPLEERNSSLRTLVVLLVAGGTLALVLACLAGYRVLRTALETVERMRRQVATVSAAEPGQRLALPEAHDELHALGATLNTMLDGLEEAASRERRFLAEASHELRTPLAVLHMELELALRGDRSPGELRRALGEALHDTERLTRMAEDLLVLARADDGRAPLARRSVDARGALAESAERLAPAVPGNREVAVQAPEGVMAFADPDRLGRALDNLLDNALRHGDGAVALAAREEDGEVVLSVADGGTGFGPEIVDVAFERFSQSRRSRSGGGNGLGLAVVRSVAEAHGGSVGVRNRPEGGAEAWMRIPRA